MKQERRYCLAHDFLTCKTSNTQSLPKFDMKIVFCSWEDLSFLFKEGLQEICISSRHSCTIYQWSIMRYQPLFYTMNIFPMSQGYLTLKIFICFFLSLSFHKNKISKIQIILSSSN